MVGIWISAVLLSLLAAAAGTTIALRIQYRLLEEGRQERDAWREAQEARQRTWEVRQAKRNLEVEKQLSTQAKDIRREWQGWQQDWHDQALQDQQATQVRVNLEQQLARLPHIEDVELPLSAHTSRQQPERWQPPALYRADLRGRDLSHRYMGRADLREAQLMGANLYMADLTGASLAGANLAGANLAGANMCAADLRGANLRGTNLLVADLHNAILHGATLLETRGLSLQQLQTAIYDTTTSIDKNIFTTPSPLPDGPVTPSELQHTAYETAPPDTGVSEPADNEITLRMPILRCATTKEIPHAANETDGKTALPHAENPRTSEQPARHRPTLAEEPLADHTPGESQEEERAEREEPPSSKIIRLQARSTKTDPPAGTKPASSKKKGNSRVNKISSISKNKDKQSRAN